MGVCVRVRVRSSVKLTGRINVAKQIDAPVDGFSELSPCFTHTHTHTVHRDDLRAGHAVDAGVRPLRPARVLPLQHGRHLPHHRRADRDASQHQPALRGRQAIRYDARAAVLIGHQTLPFAWVCWAPCGFCNLVFARWKIS